MCTQNAFRFWNRIAYDEMYAGVALSNDEGDRMCRALGDKDILFLRNHGVIVTGPTVAQAYDDLYYLERAAMVQVLAMQTGRPLHNIDEALAEHTARQIADEAAAGAPAFRIAEAPARPRRAGLAPPGGLEDDTGEMTMRIATSLMALLALAAFPAHAQLVAPGNTPGVAGGPKLGQLEIKAYQGRSPRPRRRCSSPPTPRWRATCAAQVMIRLARRGNDVGFSGGNVMRMDVSYFDFHSGTGDGPTIGGNPSYDGPRRQSAARAAAQQFEQRGGLAGAVHSPTLRIVLTLYSVDGGKVLWAATTSCPTYAGAAQNAGLAMIDTIFDQADKNRLADAGCPL